MSVIVSLTGLMGLLASAPLATGRPIHRTTFTIEARILGKNNAATAFSLGDKDFLPIDEGLHFEWVRPNQIGYVNDKGEELCLSLLHDGQRDFIGTDDSTDLRPLCDTTKERWETFVVNESDGTPEEPVVLLRDATSGQCAFLASDVSRQEKAYYLGLGDCDASNRANLVLALDNEPLPTPSSTPTSSPSPSASPVEEISPSPTPSPTPTRSPGAPLPSVCDCAQGVELHGECYDSLPEAFAKATDDDTIHVGGAVVNVAESIKFEASLTLQGHGCTEKGGRAKIVAVSSFETLTEAIFMATNPDRQSIVLRDLDITSESEGQNVAAFHSLSKSDLGGKGENQKVQLECNNVYIHDMQSQEPGVGIFLVGTNQLTVDERCVFENLLTTTTLTDKWAGGPAIAVIYLTSEGTMTIGGEFTNNRAFFPSPSTRHAGGGAIYLDWMAGNVHIDAWFDGNRANQGGAIQIQAILGEFHDNGIYSNNVAAEEGNGARFGALGCIKLYAGASFVLNGTYTDNVSEGRGGVVGTNVHEAGSEFRLQGTFRKNKAITDGGVWGRWSSTTLKGKVVIDIDSTIAENTSDGDHDDSGVYNIITSGEGSLKLSQAEWEQRTTSIVINP